MPYLTHNDVRPYDVICGRSNAASHNVGNRRFRVAISMHMQRYKATTSKIGATIIIDSLLRMLVDDVGVRFLKPVTGTSNGPVSQRQYVQVSEKRARDKIVHALRDMAMADSVSSVPTLPIFLFPNRIGRSQRSDDVTDVSTNDGGRCAKALVFSSMQDATRRIIDAGRDTTFVTTQLSLFRSTFGAPSAPLPWSSSPSLPPSTPIQLTQMCGATATAHDGDMIIGKIDTEFDLRSVDGGDLTNASIDSDTSQNAHLAMIEPIDIFGVQAASANVKANGDNDEGQGGYACSSYGEDSLGEWILESSYSSFLFSTEEA